MRLMPDETPAPAPDPAPEPSAPAPTPDAAAAPKAKRPSARAKPAPKAIEMPSTATSSRTPAAAKAHVSISKLLRTGLLDWAVTNRDTEEIHGILDKLETNDWQAVMLRLARTEEAPGKNLLVKYLMRGVTDHSEGQCKLFSAQVSEKIYGALKDLPADDEEARTKALADAQAIEKGLRAMAGAKLWDYARQGAADAAK
jgi:hypothetical protein